MAPDSSTLLLLGPDTPAIQRLLPVLASAGVAVHRGGTLDPADKLLVEYHYDVIVARHPMAGMPLDDLVRRVRAHDSPNRDSALLLVVDIEAAREVGGWLGHGVNRIVGVEASTDRLLDAIADLMSVPLTRSARSIAQLEVRFWKGGTRVLAVTRNLSRTGMLVLGGTGLAPGVLLSFEILLPGEIDPVRGELEITRRTDRNAEHLDGFGARFVAFQEDGEARFHAFLDRHRH